MQTAQYSYPQAIIQEGHHLNALFTFDYHEPSTTMSMLAYVAATVVLVVCLRRATAKRLPLVSQPYLPHTRYGLHESYRITFQRSGHLTHFYRI